GEGGISPYHLGGGDLIWELGTGYFGDRTKDGNFDPHEFRSKATGKTVKAVSLKLSQGAKPGLGGVLPKGKVNPEVARIREVLQNQKCVSPALHRVFSTPIEINEFIAFMLVLSCVTTTGFLLCVYVHRTLF